MKILVIIMFIIFALTRIDAEEICIDTNSFVLFVSPWNTTGDNSNESEVINYPWITKLRINNPIIYNKLTHVVTISNDTINEPSYKYYGLIVKFCFNEKKYLISFDSWFDCMKINDKYYQVNFELFFFLYMKIPEYYREVIDLYMSRLVINKEKQ